MSGRRDVTQIRDAPSYQARIIVAVELWLAWCAGHHVDALDSKPEQLHHAATDRRAGASDQQVLDFPSQVRHLTGLRSAAPPAWRARERGAVGWAYFKFNYQGLLGKN